jgi:hypothetical protein
MSVLPAEGFWEAGKGLVCESLTVGQVLLEAPIPVEVRLLCRHGGLVEAHHLDRVAAVIMIMTIIIII